MKFKKLSLIGFKSFANKLEIKFGEGITGIVGPNGCGKSNVADAVRWVLGEQSSKLLRGNNMQDVIFNGTKKRKSLSYAEVSLTFDNKNRSLFPSYDFEEVVITRKLFRSNESEYYINGTLCRLRDISDMLRDAGFAREGYTIIGQGRVTELINSKPEDRRAMFEEAAGISKYKFKKNEAERKNERTRANLDRINDAMEGDAARLGPLTKQAEKARQYFELKEKLKYHEINYYINQYETASDTKDKLSAVIESIDARIREKQQEYEKATVEYNGAMDSLHSIDTDLEKYQTELLNLSVNKEKVSGQIELLSQQLRNINSQNENLISSNAALNENYGSLTLKAESEQAELNRKAELLRAATEEYDKLNADYSAVADKVAEEEARMERARRALLDAMERKVAVSKNMGELTAERASLAEHIEELKARIDGLTEKTELGGIEVGERTAELDSLAAEKQKLSEEKTVKTAESSACSERLKAVTEELDEVRRDLSVSVSRKNMLAELQASMEGYAVSVRKLLADAKNNARLGNAVLGVVGQIIKVKEGFETAVEMALGSAVSNVVTKNEDDTKILIEHLKVNRYGRATFLPLTSFKPRSLDPAYMPLLRRAGCYGVATQSVEYDGMYERIISGLLGSTVIVDNMDTAVALARESSYSFRIVTLDGDMVLPQGSMTGGSKKTDAPNVFSHERDLKELTAKVDELKARADGLSAEHSELSGSSERLEQRVRELTEDIHEYEVIEAAKRTELNKLEAELAAAAESKAAGVAALDGFTARLEAVCADIDLAEKTSDELETDAQTEQDDKSRAEFETLRAERDRLRDRVAAKNLEIVTLGKDRETLSGEIARLKSEAIATAQRIESNDMAILGNNRTMQELNDKLHALADAESDSSDARRNELRTKLSDLSQYKSDLNAKAVENDRIRMACSDETSKLVEEKHEQEIVLTRVDSDMEAMQQRVGEEYGLEYEQCLEFKDEAYDPEQGGIEIAKLKRRISNLGAINENAIEESQELVKLYHEKEIQRDDLEKSLADEERIIKEMSENMLRDFDECFEKIRVNFREIFSELFNGGTADLELTENDDPLLRGVEIKAQPPAKNLQSISLLSGGEKTLTAIAILFAILKLRPMPFCLLDEIEAALDDANVGRFASYLKNFSNSTQFIVITHRKPTMEQADCLYGVTMQEEGVSTIVSVRLTDAVKDALSVPAEQ